MNKKELAERVAGDAGLGTSLALRCIQSFTQVITDELARGGKVRIAGFGTFSVTTRAARTGRNPRTGKAIQIPDQKATRFSPGRALKESVNR